MVPSRFDGNLGNGNIGHRARQRKAKHRAATVSVFGGDGSAVQFDDAAKQSGAANLMDPAGAAPAADAGEAHGRRLAADVRALWDGAAVSRS